MFPIVIYSDQISNRLRYACYILFEVVLKVAYEIKKNEPNPAPSGHIPVIFYTQNLKNDNPNSIHVIANPIIYQTGIRAFDANFDKMKGLPIIFSNQRKDDLGFDIFSAVFFMVSRYEEYLPFHADKFGRFPEIASLSAKYDFTHLPIVHHWAAYLWDCLLKKWPALSKPENKASAIFSYDIDVAFAYKGRNIKRTLLSLLKDLSRFNFKNIGNKIKTGFGHYKDPSDTYHQIFSHSFKKLFFFLLASNATEYDHNLSPKSKAIKQLIININELGIEIGIHPSYYSSENPGLIKSEKKNLENIINQIVIKSRQHFLKFKTPQTFRWLIEEKILDDYSMQYAEMPGFRAGICLPYRWFDVEMDNITGLTIHPGCIMETTFRDDILLNRQQVLEWYQRTWDEVKNVGGCFISIWHNDSLQNKNTLSFNYLHSFMIKLIEEDLAKQM